MYKRENDWWVESGGPPVTNEGQVAKLVEMTQNDEGANEEQGKEKREVNQAEYDDERQRHSP